MSDKDFNKPLGVLTQTSFIPATHQAITGNTEGSAVVWEDITPANEGKGTYPVMAARIHFNAIQQVSSNISTRKSISVLAHKTRWIAYDIKFIHVHCNLPV